GATPLLRLLRGLLGRLLRPALLPGHVRGAPARIDPAPIRVSCLGPQVVQVHVVVHVPPARLSLRDAADARLPRPARTPPDPARRRTRGARTASTPPEHRPSPAGSWSVCWDRGASPRVACSLVERAAAGPADCSHRPSARRPHVPAGLPKEAASTRATGPRPVSLSHRR